MRWKSIAGLVCLLLFLCCAASAQSAEDIRPPVPPLALLSRWAHVLSAILLLGGGVFMRFVLYPAAAKTLGGEEHEALRRTIMQSWRRVVHLCILLLLVSGFYNYFVLMPRHDGHSLYHALFGVKFLLALLVFALLSILVSGRTKPSRLRSKAPFWLSVTLSLGLIIVLIAGYMKLS